MNGHMSQQQLITYGVTGLVVVVLLAFRIMRSRQARPLKVQYLWIVPAIMLAFGALGTWGMMLASRGMPDLTGYSMMVVGLGLGSLVGWWRGKLTRIEVHPETQDVTAQASGLAIAVIVLLLAVRLGLRFLFLKDLDPRSPQAMSINIAFLLFAIGFLSVMRLEMWVRAKKLIAAAKGA